MAGKVQQPEGRDLGPDREPLRLVLSVAVATEAELLLQGLQAK